MAKHQNQAELFEFYGVDYTKTGSLKLDCDLFLFRFLREKHFVFIKDMKAFYHFSEKHFWEKINKDDILGLMFKTLKRIGATGWDTKTSSGLWELFRRECKQRDELKISKKYVCFKNGLFNLDTYKLEKHSRKVFCVHQIPFNYDENAKCPEFSSFLDDMFNGDKRTIRQVWRMIGYCFHPGTKAQSFFAMYSEGSSGKSTLCKFINKMLGGVKNVSAVKLDSLGEKFASEQIVDKMANIPNESQKSKGGAKQNTALKVFASGEPQQFQKKGKDPYTATSFAKLIFPVNGLEWIQQYDRAINRRLVLIICQNEYVDNPVLPRHRLVDRDFEDKLMTRSEIEGAIVIALKGLKRLKAKNWQFERTPEARKALKDHFEKTNLVSAFFSRCIKADEEGKIDDEDLYEIYKIWLQKSEGSLKNFPTKRAFNDLLKRHIEFLGLPFSHSKSNGNKVFRQIRLSKRGKRLAEKLQQSSRISHDGLDL